MTPIEIVEKLASLEINITCRTLLRYEKDALIPQPNFRNSRTTEYPESTFVYAYAVHQLLHVTKFRDKDIIAKVVKSSISADNGEIGANAEFYETPLFMPILVSFTKFNVLAMMGLSVNATLTAIKLKECAVLQCCICQSENPPVIIK